MSSFAASPSSAASDVPQTPGTTHHDDGVLTGVTNLSIQDESPVDVQITTSGSYKGHGSKGRYTPPFVRQGLQSKGDDVFNSPAKRKGSSPRSPTAPRKTDAMNWRSGSSSGSDPASPSPATGNRNPAFGRGKNLSAYRQAKSEDSQALYLPSCCVFVANLLQSESDESLEVAVIQAFREYGTVFVKIRRDHNNMPFAFCQYTAEEHAELAIKEGRGRLIKGRPCRCEKAKAHRLFFVERKYGPTITPEEAEELLLSFGKIDTCRPITQVERSALNLNDGVVVQFVMYDEGQAANSAFRNHDLYKLQAINGMGASPRRGSESRTSRSSADNRAYLERYDIDRRSIFIGHLPLDISEAQLHQLFGNYGEILEILIRETSSQFEPFGKFKFAFIEFEGVASVSRAINAKNGSSFGGKSIRVAQKDSDRPQNRSGRASSVASTAYQSSTARVGQQPVSPPMTQMPSSGYGSPYGYPFGSPYYTGYSNPTWVTDSQGQYYMVPPQSPYSYYAGSPAYNTGFSPSVVSGSPSSQQHFYGQGYYPYAVPHYYAAQAPNTQHQTAPSYSMTGSNVGEDRSATPTPAGHSPVVSSSMESE